MQSRKSSKKEAAGIHVISDEMLFQWMFQDATSSRADKRQLKGTCTAVLSHLVVCGRLLKSGFVKMRRAYFKQQLCHAVH